VKDVCIFLSSEKTDEWRILEAEAAPLLTAKRQYRAYSNLLVQYLSRPRFLVAINECVKQNEISCYPGFKHVASPAAKLFEMLLSPLGGSDESQLALACSRNNSLKGWWWDVLKSHDWPLLLSLLPLIIRNESNLNDFVLCAIGEGAPATFMAKAIEQGFSPEGGSDEDDALFVAGALRHFDGSAFLYTLLHTFDRSKRFIDTLRSQLEQFLKHSSNFDSIHSHGSFASLRASPFAFSLADRAGVIAKILQAVKEQAPPDSETAHKRVNIRGKGTFTEVAYDELLYNPVLARRAQLAASRLLLPLTSSPFDNRKGIIFCYSRGELEESELSILGLNGLPLPKKSTCWLFHQSDRITSSYSLLGRFACLPSNAQLATLARNKDLLTALTQYSNYSTSRVLHETMLKMGFCCGASCHKLVASAARSSNLPFLRIFLGGKGSASKPCCCGESGRILHNRTKKDTINIKILMQNLCVSHDRSMLRARREFEALQFIANATYENTFSRLVEFALKTHALSDLSVPIGSLLLESREGAVLAQRMGIGDEQALLATLKYLSIRPITTCTQILSRKSVASSLSIASLASLPSCEEIKPCITSLCLWHEWQRAAKSLHEDEANIVALYDKLVSLQLLGEGADNLSIFCGSPDERWIGRADGVVSEYLRATLEGTEVQRLKATVLENLVEWNTNWRSADEPEDVLPLSAMPIICLHGADLRRVIVGIETPIITTVLTTFFGDEEFDSMHRTLPSSAEYCARLCNNFAICCRNKPEAWREVVATIVQQLEETTQTETVEKEDNTITMWQRKRAELDATIGFHLALVARFSLFHSKDDDGEVRGQEYKKEVVTNACRSRFLPVLKLVLDFPLFTFSRDQFQKCVDDLLCICAAGPFSITKHFCEHYMDYFQHCRMAPTRAWSPIHTTLTCFENFVDASSLPLQVEWGTSLGMTEAPSLSSIGSWSSIPKCRQRYDDAKQTLLLLFRLYSRDEQRAFGEQSLAQGYPSALDLCGASRHWQALEFLLENNGGVLQGLELISSHLFLHASILANRIEILNLLLKKMSDSHPPALRHAIVCSTRKFKRHVNVPRPKNMRRSKVVAGKTCASKFVLDLLLHEAPKDESDLVSHSLLHDALSVGQPRMVQALFDLTRPIAQTISVGYATGGLLHYCVYFGFEQVLEELLCAPWSLNPLTSFDLPFSIGARHFLWSPLQLAAYRNRSKCLELLLKAMVNRHTNPSSSELYNAFLLALVSSSDETACVLLKCGCSDDSDGIFNALLDAPETPLLVISKGGMSKTLSVMIAWLEERKNTREDEINYLECFYEACARGNTQCALLLLKKVKCPAIILQRMPKETFYTLVAAAVGDTRFMAPRHHPSHLVPTHDVKEEKCEDKQAEKTRVVRVGNRLYRGGDASPYHAP